MTAVARAAHAHGKLAVVQAVSQDVVIVALDAGADIITHVQFGPPLEPLVVARSRPTAAPWFPR